MAEEEGWGLQRREGPGFFSEQGAHTPHPAMTPPPCQMGTRRWHGMWEALRAFQNADRQGHSLREPT